MSGNGYGDHLATRTEDLAAHDRASPAIRFLANYSVAKWSSKHLVLAVSDALTQRRFLSRGDAIAQLARGIRRGERADTLNDYGPDHPEARA
jgi:hypothetical protein